jgi:carboxyl-terminal processing protease
MTHRLARLVLLFGASLLTACGGGGIDSSSGASGATLPAVSAGGSDCSSTRLKQSVLDTAREWYLFPELLPASVDIAAFDSPESVLDFITATARLQSQDRFFSYLTGIAAENAVLQGSSAGFGFNLVEQASPARLFVGQVYEGSVAADNGFARGDEILAIGSTPGSLQSIAQIAAAPGGIDAALGPVTAGVSRVLRWRSAAGGATLERALTKRAFDLNAVPASSVRILSAQGGLRVGHVTLRSFVADPTPSGQNAELAALRAAFATFGAQGVTNVIVDLRYNGGGLVSIAELLLNLIAGDQVGQLSYATRLNARQTARQETRRFVRQPQTVPTTRIAFLTTTRTASASELVINSVAPYVRTAVVGSRSFGKPVGQFAFDVPACDFRLRLVSFKSVNRNEDGDYFGGLPDAALQRTGAVGCAADDDLTRPLGDANEAMTATALAWLASPTASCPGATLPAAGRPATADVGDPGATASRKSQPARSLLPGIHPWLPGTY